MQRLPLMRRFKLSPDIHSFFRNQKGGTSVCFSYLKRRAYFTSNVQIDWTAERLSEQKPSHASILNQKLCQSSNFHLNAIQTSGSVQKPENSNLRRSRLRAQCNQPKDSALKWKNVGSQVTLNADELCELRRHRLLKNQLNEKSGHNGNRSLFIDGVQRRAKSPLRGIKHRSV